MELYPDKWTLGQKRQWISIKGRTLGAYHKTLPRTTILIIFINEIKIKQVCIFVD